MLIPVVLAGGTGSRLWPVSRELFPKQFLPLVDSFSLLQNTIRHTSLLPHQSHYIVMCNEQHRFIAAEQLAQLGVIENTSLILESASRNTAPAIALAALHALTLHDDPVLLILAADHLIKDAEKFTHSVEIAIPQAENNYLVTFGIKPTYPETGYGYIKANHQQPIANDTYAVNQFIEKPPYADAERYFAEGHYYWNSGMFAFKAKAILQQLAQHAPDILEICEAAFKQAHSEKDFIRVAADIFEQCRSESIDYAVMEKTDRAVVVPMHSTWNDIGSWAALWQVGNADDAGNVMRGDVIAHETTNCYIRADSRLVTTIGLQDCIVAETNDAVLVAHKNYSQQVKKIVEQLKAAKRTEAESHRLVHRPWGAYQIIDEGLHFKVKRIIVKPHASLSLQMHHHRSEHWIIVDGIAEITRGEEIFTLEQNTSTYIPAGTTHRLKNIGATELHLIEVQSGIYLGEDDIVRFEDNYGRIPVAASTANS